MNKSDYINCADPTEYRFVRTYHNGDWEGWERMCETPEFSPVIAQWRKELTIKLRSDALRRILEAAHGETRDALAANKYIYEILGKEEKGPVGRPSKEAIMREANKLFEDNRAKEEAYDRIFATSGRDQLAVDNNGDMGH